MAGRLRFFLGANGPGGYHFRYDQLGEPGQRQRWLLKGGPGWGKSTLLSRLSRAAAEQGEAVEEILCTGSPGSLDAVLLPGLSAADATPPHALEPFCPGAWDRVVSLWPAADCALLREAREELAALAREEERLRKGARGYLRAAAALEEELLSVGSAALDRERVLDYARRLARREFPRRGKPGPRGQEEVRFLSAVTGEGRLFLGETAAALAPRAVALEDGWGAASGLLLDALRELGLEAGLRTVACPSPRFPGRKLDHLLFPQLGLGFFTRGKETAGQLPGARGVHAGRFSDEALLRERRARCAFLRKAAGEMEAEAVGLLARAGEVHRELEALCRPAIDYAAVTRIGDGMLAEMLG